jgi:aromatic ring-opening dioxygenase LigB subunit
VPGYRGSVPLVAAAVCPHPPLLVPEIAAGAAAELDPLRAACSAAAGSLASAAVDTLVVVGGDKETVRRSAPYGGTFLPWGVDLRVGAPTADPLPLSLLMGAWLAPAADRFVSVATHATVDECVALGRALVGTPENIGLLVMGDGSARRGEKSPGYADPRAEDFDRAVADALASASVKDLLALDPDLAAELWAAGRAPWQVLAGAAEGAGLRGELHYAEAPYGVCYLVASWR